MKKQPPVSVIVPTKNEETNILRCLRSIKNQSYITKPEIIVVDSGTDNTALKAKKYTTKIIKADPTVERSCQRNLGAKKAKGDWLLFIDADMQLSKNVIAECIELARESLTRPMIAINEQSKGYNFWGKALALEKNSYKSPSWVQAARFFPKNVYLKFGGYDENLVAGEDWDITQRLTQHGVPILITKSRIFHHEPKSSLRQLLRKEIYYINHINKYAKKQPRAFSYQGSFIYRGFLWIRNWRELIKNPIHATAFILYKFIVWLMWISYTKTHSLKVFL